MQNDKENPRFNRRQRRETIVDAALNVFSRYGYRGATTRRLANAAGITEVTLFRYFPTKETLFGAVMDKYSILPLLRGELNKTECGGDARQSLRRLARRIIRVLRDRRDMIRLILSEAIVNPRQAQAYARQGPARIIEEMSKLLASMHERGEVRRVDFVLGARVFLGALLSFIVLEEIVLGSESGPQPLEKTAEQLADILWRGLREDNSEGR